MSHIRILALIVVFLLAVLITISVHCRERTPDPELDPPATIDELTEYIHWKLSDARKDVRWHRAPDLAQIIHKKATDAGVPPLLVAVVIYHESSFREGQVRGKDGELGLGQFHGTAAKGVDLKTSEGQIEGVAGLLAKGSRECPTDLLSTLSYYQAGKCRTGSSGPRIRRRELGRAVRRILNARSADSKSTHDTI